MSNRLKEGIAASELAGDLGLMLSGPDLEVTRVCPVSELMANALTFSKEDVPLNPEVPVLVVGPGGLARGRVSVLVSDHPRLDFIRGLNMLERKVGFERPANPPNIHPTVRVGKNTVLENGVVVGEQTVIGHNVVIAEGVTIGKACLIKPGAVIGGDGFGFERESSGTPIRMPQLGSVRIGDEVEIGSLTTICRGSLGDTVIGDHVKIDDHVHIAHNCQVSDNVIITACAELSGGVEVGEGAWIAPNCAVLQKIKIGDRAFIGIGAAVIQDVQASVKVFGYPARLIPKAPE